MKSRFLLTVTIALAGCTAPEVVEVKSQLQVANSTASIIAKSKWIHGSANCETNMDPAQEVYQHDESTFIIRQNKCLNFEAPFIYVLAGEEQVLVLDTGALDEKVDYSFYQHLTQLLAEHGQQHKEILVVHSHGHGDHMRGDESMAGKPKVKLIDPTAESLQHFFGFNDWPQGSKIIDLGKREITVMPTPGHQEEAITLYDSKTKWLLTGDTLYPGYVYVKDWSAYKTSINKLANFANQNEVSAVLGTHIEMKAQSGSYYPIGSTYQPDEAHLALAKESLIELNSQLKQTKRPAELKFAQFIIKPMSQLQQAISDLGRWLLF